MKLIIAIIQDEDASEVISHLNEAKFQVTRLSTKGGFLRAGNTTIMTGVEDEKVEGALKIIEENSVPMFGDYAQVKAAVMAVKAQIDSVCDIQNVPCHNDPLCENWVLSADDDRLYLIDWEYAGMNDGIWDLADVSIEGVFTPENDELLLTEYLGSKPDQNEYKHFLANKIYVDYLWTLWAKTRVPYDGQPMEDWAVERYARLKDNLRLFAEA